MPDQLAFRGAFKASAAGGTVYLVDVFDIMPEDQSGEIRGPLLYRTTDGKPVKRLDIGLYEIEESGLVVRRRSESFSGSNPQAAQ
jgi:hypothetical protein